MNRITNNNNIDILTGEYVKLYFEKASAGKRVAATLIDWALYAAIYYVMIFIVYDTIGSTSIKNILLYSTIVLIGINSMFVEYFTKGYTLGKYLMRIKVINDQCTPPTFLQCFMRWLLFTIDFSIGGVLGLILICMKGQRLGDMASGCQVIYIKERGEKEVDLKKDFRYIDEEYKVHYPEVARLKESTIVNIKNLLYCKNYGLNKHDYCKKLREHLNVNDKVSNDEFLDRLYQDYMYLKNNP